MGWQPARNEDRNPRRYQVVKSRDRKLRVFGLVWSRLVVDGVTRKITSKTGAIATHDLSMYPNVQQIVALVGAVGSYRSVAELRLAHRSDWNKA